CKEGTDKSRRLIMAEQLKTLDIELKDPNEALALFGTKDKYLKHIEEQMQATIVTRGEKVHLSGQQEDIQLVKEILNTLLSVIRQGVEITERDVVYAVELAKSGKINQLETLFA